MTKKEKTKRCKTCDFCQYFWRGIRADKKQYYCQRKLQKERQKSDGNQVNSYIKPNDLACEHHTDD